MLSPKRTKYRKQHKGRIHGLSKGGTALNFGAFGLKALEPERITARQIESAHGGSAHACGMKRTGRVWIRIFPDVPVSTKPAEVRMGSGERSPGVLGRLRRSREEKAHHVLENNRRRDMTPNSHVRRCNWARPSCRYGQNSSRGSETPDGQECALQGP